MNGILVVCASLAMAQQPAIPPPPNLMPVPASVNFTGDRLAIDQSFKVATRGHSDARLQAAIARFVKRLEGRTVLTFAPGLAPDDQMTTLEHELRLLLDRQAPAGPSPRDRPQGGPPHGTGHPGGPS